MSGDLDIHPDFQSVKGRVTPLTQFPLALMNGLISVVNAIYQLKYKSIIRKVKITGFDGQQIPLLIIQPENLAPSCPALVYYHGGAFVYKYAPPHIDNAVRYAREANCLVVFVDYRLAPKHPFPAAFNDAYGALQWTLSNAAKLGVDANRIAVGGDSAGGTLAASAAQKAIHDDGITLCGQLLIYPGTDSHGETASMQAFTNVPPFKALDCRAIWEAYLGHPLADGTPQYAAPAQGNLSNVAKAYVETCEFDPLRDEGNAYAQALQDMGVEVSAYQDKGAIHGFDLVASSSDYAKRVVSRRIEFLRTVFQA